MEVKHLRKLPCKTCGIEFKQKTITQLYCGRPCYNISLKEKEENYGHPSYVCEHCKKETKLTFDPIKDYNKLEAFICSHCGQPRKKTIS